MHDIWNFCPLYLLYCLFYEFLQNLSVAVVDNPTRRQLGDNQTIIAPAMESPEVTLIMPALFHLCESILPGMSGQNDQDDITVPVIGRRLHICSSPLPGDSVQFQKTFLR